jgi:hypothetical protein
MGISVTCTASSVSVSHKERQEKYQGRATQAGVAGVWYQFPPLLNNEIHSPFNNSVKFFFSKTFDHEALILHCTAICRLLFDCLHTLHA